MNIKKPPLVMKEATVEQPPFNAMPRPKNLSANLLPTKGYILEIDGKFKTEYETAEAALKAGLELKTKYQNVQVMVYGAKERTRTPVKLSEKATASI
jgi:hypothetical protein